MEPTADALVNAAQDAYDVAAAEAAVARARLDEAVSASTWQRSPETVVAAAARHRVAVDDREHAHARLLSYRADRRADRRTA